MSLLFKIGTQGVLDYGSGRESIIDKVFLIALTNSNIPIAQSKGEIKMKNNRPLVVLGFGIIDGNERAAFIWLIISPSYMLVVSFRY